MNRRRFMQIFSAALITAMAAVAYPFVEVLARPQVTRYRLVPHGWPAGLKLRVALLADFHAATPWMDRQRIEAICAQTQELEADIILLLGDYVAGMRLILERVPNAHWATALGQLSAPLGVHAILGNHDYWEDADFQNDPARKPKALEALEAVGIPVYVNTATRLEKDGHGFWLAGLGDQLALLRNRAAGRDRIQGIDDMEAALRAITDDGPVLLMAHEPDIFMSPDPRVALTVSGHTHGGQINFFGSRPWAASTGSRRFPIGHYQ
ncbi:MAG: metallophosphoesterase, partial [Hyphomicrobiales bacterium]